MSGRKRPRGEIATHLLRQLEEPHEVCDRASILADRRGDLVLRERELGGETLIGERFVDRVEPFTLEVLDERELEERFIAGRHVTNDDGHRAESGTLRGSPASFAGDDVIALAD